MIEEPILPQLPDFEEYILQGEPDQRQRAENWKIAIGLQAVDGLHTSDYLLQLARQHIEGKITMTDVKRLLNDHYKSSKVPEIQSAKQTFQSAKIALWKKWLFCNASLNNPISRKKKWQPL